MSNNDPKWKRAKNALELNFGALGTGAAPHTNLRRRAGLPPLPPLNTNNSLAPSAATRFVIRNGKAGFEYTAFFPINKPAAKPNKPKSKSPTRRANSPKKNNATRKAKRPNFFEPGR
jgi:hypothetical protein